MCVVMSERARPNATVGYSRERHPLGRSVKLVEKTLRSNGGSAHSV